MVKYVSVFHPKENIKDFITHDCILGYGQRKVPVSLLAVHCYRFTEESHFLFIVHLIPSTLHAYPA